MRTLSNPQWAIVQFTATGLGALLASLILVADYVVSAQEPEPTTYTTAAHLLKWGEGFEAATPPGFENFYDKDYYGPAQIYCTNGYDFDIWIVTKDGAVTVPAKGTFVLTKKGE